MTKTVVSYSFNNLRDLYAAYVFTSKRYHGPVVLYESHREANFPYLLVFLKPHLDKWGADKKIDRVVCHRDLDVQIGDYDRAPFPVLIEQAHELPLPTSEEVKRAKQDIKILRKRNKKWWEIWK